MNECDVERAARAGWDYAEARECTLAESIGKRYTAVSWEDAHPLDHEEYRAYVRVIAEALLDAERTRTG